MNKIYLLLIVCAMAATSQKALPQSKNIVNSFTLYDLTKERMNNAYTDNQGNAIKIKTNEPTIGTAKFIYYADIDNPLACAGETNEGLQPPIQEKYTRFLLKGAKNATNARSPYFIVEFDEESTIKQMQIMGTAAGTNEGAEELLLYAFSKVENPTLADFEEMPLELPPLEFIVGSCNYQNLRIDIPKDTRAVIFIATDDFAGWGITSYTNPPEFDAIRFFAEEKTATAIETQEKDKTEYTLEHKDEIISANQLSDITIYNMAGQKVMQVKNTKQAELNNLNKGIYIIKAVSKINGHVFVKKISLV